MFTASVALINAEDVVVDTQSVSATNWGIGKKVLVEFTSSKEFVRTEITITDVTTK